MEYQEFRKILQEKANKLQIDISEKQVNQFYDYMNLLIEWNKVMNLTAIIEPNDIILKHFIDCMTIYKYILEGNKVADIGTGAGFPGIPLAIMNIDSEYILVDSLNKRIRFLEEVKNKLKLQNVVLLHNRAEEFGNKNREKYDITACRAVASLPVLLEYMLPVLKVGGKCICMKGSNIEEELENSKKALKILGGEIEVIEKLDLPDSDMQRNIIIIKKTKKTEMKYPRKAGIPTKEPIC